jgi:hypothetical protein
MGTYERGRRVMNLEFLAISDTHLGESTSLLHRESGLKRFTDELRDKFEVRGNERLNVKELILLGDIVDKCLASKKQMAKQANLFLHALMNTIKPRRIVFVPGNHDHELWTRYCQFRTPPSTVRTTSLDGDLMVRDGKLLPEGDAAKEYLEILFNYYDGDNWLRIGKDRTTFILANPVYAKVKDNRSYVFTHGTHLKVEVVFAEKVLLLLESLGLIDETSWGLPRLGMGFSRRKPATIKQIEERSAEFVDFMWRNRRDEPTPKRDKFWYVVRKLSGRISDDPRPIPLESRRYSQSELPDPKRVESLWEDNAFTCGSLDRWRDYFLVPLLKYLKQHDRLRPNMTFVYGDTHKGGFGEVDLGSFDLSFSGPAPKTRIYNTGAWIADVKTSHRHPACHVFAVDAANDQEYLLDVSFRNIHEGDSTLLDVTDNDIEHIPPSPLKGILDRIIHSWKDYLSHRSSTGLD